MKAFTYTAGLAQLIFMLVCACIAEYAPVAGRHLGRWAGRTIRAGRDARRWYDAHAARHVREAIALAEYEARQFVAEQFGDAAPRARAWAAPARVSLYEVATIAIAVEAGIGDTASMTIRELKAIARERGIPNWSRLRKAELIAAIG